MKCVKEVLYVKYIDYNKIFQNKYIIINEKKLLHNENIEILIQNHESNIIVIYENDNYTNETYKQYDNIIKSNLENTDILKYIAKYCYLDYI